MTLKVIADALGAVAERKSAVGRITYHAKGPFHLAQGLEPIRPHWHFSGVYVLTKPTAPNWNIPFGESDADVWYIGMTTANIFECMVRHFGRPLTESPVSYEHRWTNGSARHDIEECLQRGEVVLYPIELRPEASLLTGRQRDLVPALVEKHMLIAYIDRYGDLPPLNLSM